MTSQRSWFPYILAGLTVLLTAAFLVVEQRLDDEGRNDRAPQTVQAPLATESSYAGAATAILAGYATDGDAKRAYDALIVLRVPPAMQSAHFDLVVAFGKLLAG